MTYIEKYMLDNPDCSEGNIITNFCPSNFNLEKGDSKRCRSFYSCEECWNREIPEEKKVKTCLDQIKEDDPDYVDDRYWGGANGCPHHYFVGAVPKCKNENINSCNLVCTACWNQPLPEENIPEAPKKKEYESPTLEVIADKIAETGIVSNAAYEAARSLTKGLIDGTQILDSGNRREFESGAVRDIQEGKGRCDLLPLDVVDLYLDDIDVVGNIDLFTTSGDWHCLFFALEEFRSFVRVEKCDLILEVAKHFEEGAKKYGENNWQKGIPVRCYIDSAVRHYLKFLRGDKDEPHDRAFCWNIMCAIWTCKHKPELNDYVKKESDTNAKREEP